MIHYLKHQGLFTSPALYTLPVGNQFNRNEGYKFYSNIINNKMALLNKDITYDSQNFN